MYKDKKRIIKNGYVVIEDDSHHKRFDTGTGMIGVYEHVLIAEQEVLGTIHKEIGMNVVSKNSLIESIAKLAHEANKRYCESIGDLSQPTWEDAPDWQRQSAINGVKHVLANPDATPEDSHNSWLKEKQADGWKYGPVKDPQKKEHPCYVPYAELPKEQQAKDFIILDTVRTAMAEHNL